MGGVAEAEADSFFSEEVESKFGEEMLESFEKIWIQTFEAASVENLVEEVDTAMNEMNEEVNATNEMSEGENALNEMDGGATAMNKMNEVSNAVNEMDEGATAMNGLNEQSVQEKMEEISEAGVGEAMGIDDDGRENEIDEALVKPEILATNTGAKEEVILQSANKERLNEKEEENGGIGEYESGFQEVIVEGMNEMRNVIDDNVAVGVKEGAVKERDRDKERFGSEMIKAASCEMNEGARSEMNETATSKMNEAARSEMNEAVRSKTNKEEDGKAMNAVDTRDVEVAIGSNDA